MSLSLPALVLVWVFGMGLVGMSNDIFEMSQAGSCLARRVGGPDGGQLVPHPPVDHRHQRACGEAVSAGIGMTHVVLIVMLLLMVFKPGAPAGF